MRKPILHYAVAVCILGSAATAQAVIRNVSAEIVSEVSDQDGSSDQAIENFGDTGMTLPISTRANLVAFDSAEAVIAEGVSLADFKDLTASGGRNPEEIGIEADCFSNDSTSYDLESTVVETRIVSFDTDELDLPPFSSSTSQTVNSTVFASGAMLLFSVDDDRDLTGLSAEVSFVVERFGVGDDDEPTGDGEVLLDKTVSLNGGADGAVTLRKDPDLFVFAGDLTILPDDPDGAGTGLGVGGVDLGAVTVAQVAIILGQNISYSYEATAGQEFILQATFTVTASNLPDGTGVVAVFGRGLDEAVRILEIGLPEESAKSVVRRVNRAIDEFSPKGEDGSETSPLLALPCAMLGFEMIPLGLLSLTFLIGRGARRGRLRGHSR